MNAFHTLRRAFASAAVLFLLYLGAGMALRADETVSENFDSFQTGGLTSLTTALGTMTAESGHAAIANNRWSSQPNCLRLIGLGAGTKSTATLTLPAPLAVKKMLSLTGERWTSANPFSFTIHAVDREGEETLVADGSSLKTGGNPMTQQVTGIIPSGTAGLIFRCEAPAGTGVLLDDLAFSEFKPFSSAAEAWPAMIRMEANGILRFSLTETPSTYAGMAVTVDMSPSDDLGDIESVSLYTGDANSIYSTPAYGSGGHGAMNSPGILASPAQPPAPVMTFPVTPGAVTDGQQYYFWVSVKLKDSASMDHKVGARIASVTADGETTDVTGGVTARQRIGYAIAKANDPVYGGPTEGKTSRKFRIPGIVRARNGDLVSVFDIRYDGRNDMQANIDTGCSRSTDNGRTWTPVNVAVNFNPTGNSANDYNSGYGVSDPCILLDEVNGTLWVAGIARHGLASSKANVDVESLETVQYVVAYSTDNGQTWGSADPDTGEFVKTKPRSINGDIKNRAWKSFFQGPGHGITMKKTVNGVRPIVFPSQIWTGTSGAGTPQSCIIYSLDRGQTWISEDTGKSGTLGIGASASECVVTELSDGRLMLNARNENKSGYRKVFTSDDMGKTWTAHATNLKALPEPAACQASQLAVENSGNIGRALLFSNPAKTAAPRALMTLKASFDEGATWPANRQVLYDSRPCCGYSDICETGDGHIGVLYEGLNGDENIFFLRIPHGEFLPSLDVPAAAQTIRVEAEGVTAATFTVSSDDSWEASSSADWITVSPASGSGNGTVTYSVDRWEGAGERTGTITVTVPGVQPAVVTIIQSGRAPALAVSPGAHVLPKNGGTAIFSVTCDAAWTVSKTADWVDITGTQGAETGNGTVSIAVAANPGESSRTAGFSFSSFGTVRSATVVQRGQKRTWDEWKEDEITSRDPDAGQTGPNDSPAGDGIPNLLKYATGLDPLKPCGSVVQVSTEEAGGGAFLALDWPVNPEATGIRHLVEASEDLRTWEEAGEVETEGKRSATFQDAVPINAEAPRQHFLRLKISREGGNPL